MANVPVFFNGWGPLWRTLVAGVCAFGLLVALHTIVARLSLRFERFRRLVEPEPALLLHHGKLLWGAMQKERVTEREIREAVRASGLPSIELAEAVILEADGEYNVIQRPETKQPSRLEGVIGFAVKGS